MPYNGAGTFARLRSWVADKAGGLPIDAGLMDSDTNDIATALNNVMTRDGQGGAKSDIPWNGHKITGLAPPTNAGDVLSLGSTPASEITAILGSAPWTAANLVAPWKGSNLTAAALNAIAGVGQLLGTANLTAAEINALAGQNLYGTANLTAAALNAIAGVGQLLGTANMTPAEMNALAGVGQLYGTANLGVAAIRSILGGIPAFSRTGQQPYIGYNGASPDVQIDGSYFGAIWNSLLSPTSGGYTGYQKLQSGLIIQWGQSANPGADFAIGFPIGFPNYCSAVVASLLGYGGATTIIAVTLDTFTPTYFNARPRYITYASGAGVATQPVSWIAVGF